MTRHGRVATLRLSVDNHLLSARLIQTTPAIVGWMIDFTNAIVNRYGRSKVMAQTYSGGCQCAKVRYEVQMDIGEVIACNCSRCGRLQFDLRSAQGKLMASMMAALAEFEKDLLRERVRSGIAAALKRVVVFNRRSGQRVKSDRLAPKVLQLVGAGQSYREIRHRLDLSKNTVLDIVRRDRAA